MNTDKRYEMLQAGLSCVANRSSKANDTLLIRWAAERGLALYIGRANGRLKLKQSLWHNPFRGDDAIERFQEYLATQPELLSRIPELRGKLLVCWCHPQPCHGDVLAQLANGGSGLVPCAFLLNKTRTEEKQQ